MEAGKKKGAMLRCTGHSHDFTCNVDLDRWKIEDKPSEDICPLYTVFNVMLTMRRADSAHCTRMAKANPPPRTRKISDTKRAPETLQMFGKGS